MKTIIKIFILCGIIVIMAFSCENEKTENPQLDEFIAFGDVKICEPVAIRLTLQDTNFLPSSTFEEGENFVFCLEIMNLSDSLLFFKHYSINIEDLFKVYKINDDGGEIYIGKPFCHIFCNAIGGQFIGSNGIWGVRISWLEDITLDANIQCPGTETYHNETLPLSLGKYKTKFSSKFKFGDFEIDTLNFNYEFEIK
jgi:hypothetical protein